MKATESRESINQAAGQLLSRLDSQQDELLQQLAELESKIEAVFEQWGIRSTVVDDETEEA